MRVKHVGLVGQLLALCEESPSNGRISEISVRSPDFRAQGPCAHQSRRRRGKPRPRELPCYFRRNQLRNNIQDNRMDWNLGGREAPVEARGHVSAAKQGAHQCYGSASCMCDCLIFKFYHFCHFSHLQDPEDASVAKILYRFLWKNVSRIFSKVIMIKELLVFRMSLCTWLRTLGSFSWTSLSARSTVLAFRALPTLTVPGTVPDIAALNEKTPISEPRGLFFMISCKEMTNYGC